jgi:hypothetical protein
MQLYATIHNYMQKYTTFKGFYGIKAKYTIVRNNTQLYATLCNNMQQCAILRNFLGVLWRQSKIHNCTQQCEIVGKNL